MYFVVNVPLQQVLLTHYNMSTSLASNIYNKLFESYIFYAFNLQPSQRVVKAQHWLTL